MNTPQKPQLHKHIVMPRFLTILIMASIQAIVTICVRNLESYIAFPIAYFVGWSMCIIWNKLYS